MTVIPDGNCQRSRREDRLRLNNDVLDDEILIALEARTGFNVLGLDHLGLMNCKLWALGAASTGFALSFRALLRRLLHAARLQLRPAFDPLEPHNLLAQRCDQCILLGNLLVGLQ